MTPNMQQLVLFDVDGTLTHSTLADGLCYAQVMSAHLDIDVDTDWSTYRYSTESGIAQELFARAGRPLPTTRDLEPVRRRLLTLLDSAFAADAGACTPVPGARALIERLRAEPNLSVAIATGAWGDSARLKLRHAGLAVTDLPLATADDAVVREDIMTIARTRAAEHAGVTRFDRVTYVGDQVWDVVAAQMLGFAFVGVRVDGDLDYLRAAGATTVVRDLSAADLSLFV